MANIYLYAHGGSGNHGCEAIVRSTSKILYNKPVTLISSNPKEDRFYEIDKLCKVVKDTSGELNRRDPDFWKAFFALKIRRNHVPMDKLWYKDAFSDIHKDDVALSIGGDNYCYADVQKYVMLHDILKKRGAKTVLWGCSVEPEIAMLPEIAADLSRYDLITARESITYKALKSINPNTVLVADPAFLLEKHETVLPENFLPGSTVGINLSPMVMNNEAAHGITWVNYTMLIDFILKETNMNIALIPHVVWNDGDDRIPLKKLYDLYNGTNRIAIVNDLNCMRLKYIISQCRFFIGARTHSTIAAYSSCVPTITVGYSVKSRGIAHDLFETDKGYVIPVQELKDEHILKDAFYHIMLNEDKIKNKLITIVPKMKELAKSSGQYIANLFS